MEVHGHSAGDTALRTFAGRLAGTVRAEDTVARLHGDEFVVLLEHHDPVCAEHERTLTALVELIGSRILAAAARPIVVDGRSHHLTVSIGTTAATAATADAHPDHVLSRADTAMYEAKARGRNQHVADLEP